MWYVLLQTRVVRNKNITFIRFFYCLKNIFTCPIGQVAPKFYLPHLNFYLPQASGQGLMLSPEDAVQFSTIRYITK